MINFVIALQLAIFLIGLILFTAPWWSIPVKWFFEHVVFPYWDRVDEKRDRRQ